MQCAFTLPCRVAGEVKVQASAAAGVGDVIFDLVGDDRLSAQITPSSCAVACIDVGRKHERQLTLLDEAQDAGVKFGLR